MLTSNAIAYAHFELRGGWKKTLVTAGLYAAAIVGMMILASVFDPGGFGSMRGWTTAILALQSAVLVLFATSRISVAILGDLKQQLIESHRLMPLAAWEAIVGYMVGGASPALMLAAVNFLVGAVTASVGGVGLDAWFAANFILLTFSIFLWTVMVASAFTTAGGKGGAGWVVGLIIFMLLTHGMLAIVLPGLMLVASPAMGPTIYALQSGTRNGFPVEYGFSLPSQVAIGLLCFTAAARKYRRPEFTAFTPLMAMLLLWAWAAVSVVALRFWDEVVPSQLGGLFGASRTTSEWRAAQVIVSTLSVVLLAMLPITNSSRADIWRRRQRDTGEDRRDQMPVSPLSATILSSIACIAIPLLSGTVNPHLLIPGPISNAQVGPLVWAVALTAAIVLAQLCLMGRLVRVEHVRRGRSGGWAVTFYVVLLWLVPLGIDALIAWNAGRRGIGADDPIFSTVSTLSPIGALIDVWGTARGDPTIGVIGQVVLAVVISLLFLPTTKWRKALAEGSAASR